MFADPAGDGWHMLITARANEGDVDNRGVIGHAVSRDLETWDVRPPLSRPGAGFGHREVLQTAVMDDRTVLLFSCGVDTLIQEAAAVRRWGDLEPGSRPHERTLQRRIGGHCHGQRSSTAGD